LATQSKSSCTNCSNYLGYYFSSSVLLLLDHLALAVAAHLAVVAVDRGDSQADSPVEDTLHVQVEVDPNVVVGGRGSQVEADSLAEAVPSMEEDLHTYLADALVDNQGVVHRDSLVAAVCLVHLEAGLLFPEHLEHQKVSVAL
jgi:hypothetical protein